MKVSNFTALSSTLIVTGLLSAQANAESTTALEEVVVTGQLLEETLPQELAKYGTRVDTISSQQILNGGYVDIAETLQSLAPGLYVSSKNGPFDYVDISLQGSRTKDVLWLIDGVRINNRLYGGTSPLDALPSSMVERIEVLDGGQALFYGTQAAAGAVNIVTKSFTNAADGAFALGGDTNGGRHLDAYFRDALGKHQFVVYGSSDQSDGFQPFRDSDYQPSATDRHRSYDVLTGGLKYAYDFTDNLRFTTLYQHTDGKLDFLSPMLTASTFNERDENLLSAKLDYTINDAVQLFIKGYGHWWYSHYTEFDHVLDGSGAVVPGTLDVVDDHDFWGYKDYGANVMTKLALNRGFEYLVGYDLQRYSGNDAVLVISKQTESVNAFFAQVRTTPELLSSARFAAGLRYNDPSVGQAATVWNVSGHVDITDGLFVRGSAGTSFRLPSAEELFADDPNDERGNPNLKPEQSRNLNLSIGGRVIPRSGQLKWEVTGFFRDISNLISFDGFDDQTNQSVAQNTAGKVKVRGAEFDLDAALTASLTANMSVTYNKATQQDNDLQITRIPVRQYKLGLDYHPTDLPFGVTATLDHVGDVYASVWDGREKYGDYTVIDLAGRVYLDAGRRHTINIRLQNALDKQYASALGSAQRDADGSDYTYWNLGVPRSLSARYVYKF